MDGKSEKHKIIGKKLSENIPSTMNHQDIADRARLGKNPEIKKSQSYISQMLKGRPASDEAYIEIGRVIGLSEKQVRDIIFEGEQKRLEYEYPDRFKSKGGLTDEEKELLKQIPEDVKVAFSKTGDLKQSDIDQIAGIIEFLKSKRN